MKFSIYFPFHGYTKGDLIEFCFGKHADVDTAIPLNLIKVIQNFTNNLNGHHWYVMDYTENKIGGKLVNLKEKFFNVVAQKYMDELPLRKSHGEKNSSSLIPFRFKLLHDKGESRILVYSTDEASAKQLIMQAEGCPERAILRLRA